MASIYIKIIYLGIATTRPHEGIYRTLTYLKLSSVSLSSPHPSPFLFDRGYTSSNTSFMLHVYFKAALLIRVFPKEFVKRMAGSSERERAGRHAGRYELKT